jgi:hypothetical protein
MTINIGPIFTPKLIQEIKDKMEYPSRPPLLNSKIGNLNVVETNKTFLA